MAETKGSSVLPRDKDPILISGGVIFITYCQQCCASDDKIMVITNIA